MNSDNKLILKVPEL